MRRVVVLPAPFAPSRPVICPSCAAKLTPSTACTRPLGEAKLLRTSSTWIMARDSASGLPAVGACERRRVLQLVEARPVERACVGTFDEVSDQPGRATYAHHRVALAAQHEVTAARQRALHFSTV